MSGDGQLYRVRTDGAVIQLWTGTTMVQSVNAVPGVVRLVYDGSRVSVLNDGVEIITPIAANPDQTLFPKAVFFNTGVKIYDINAGPAGITPDVNGGIVDGGAGFQRLPRGELRTSLGTAAGFTGQGALATKANVTFGTGDVAGFGALAGKASVTYGTGDVSGFGALAGRATARLGFEIFRSNNTTLVNDADAVTSLGTAAGIVGQGALATKASVTYGTADVSGFGALAAKGSLAYGDALLTGFGALATRASLAYGDAALTGFGALAGRATARLGYEIYRANNTTLVGDADAVTSLGTAAGIVGQGALATKGSVAYGTADVSGFGALAARGSLAYGDALLTGFGALAGKGSVDLATGEVINKSLANVDSGASTKLSTIEAGANRSINDRAINRNSSFSDWVSGAVQPWRAYPFGTYFWNPEQVTTNSTRGQYCARVEDNELGVGDYVPMANGETYWLEYSFTVAANGAAGAAKVYVGATAFNGAGEMTAAGDHALVETLAFAGSGRQFGRVKRTFANSAGGLRPVFGTLAYSAGCLVDLDYLAITRDEPGSSFGADLNSNVFDTGGANPTVALPRNETRTALGTAAAITGQGALATKASVTYGTADVAGFGGLAGRNTARLGSEVRRADDVTVVNDADAITSLGVAASIAGQAATATNASFDAVTGTNKPENKATVDAQVTSDAGATITIYADSAGVPTADQLPRSVSMRLMRGGVQVASGVTWSVTRLSGSVTSSISGTGAGTLTVSGPSTSTLSAESVIRIKANYLGVDRTFDIKVVKVSDPATVSGTASGSTSGTSVSTTTLPSTNGTTAAGATYSAPLICRTGPNGDINFSANLEFVRSASTSGATGVMAVWQWRAIGGVFADVSTPIADSLDAVTTVQTEPGAPNFVMKDNGNIAVTQSKLTGLAASTDYECRMGWWRTHVAENDSNVTRASGTMYAVGS